MKRLILNLLVAVIALIPQISFSQIDCLGNLAPTVTGQTTLELECGTPLPDLPPVFLDLDILDIGLGLQIDFTQDTLEGDCGNTIINYWIATDICGNQTSFTQTIGFSDNTAPVLSATPADLELECGSTLPEAPVITATDDCGGDIEVIYSEGAGSTEPGPEDSELIFSSALATPDMMAPQWSAELFSFPGGPFRLITQEAHISVWENAEGVRDAHITGTLVSSTNENGGFYLDLWLHEGVNWNTWNDMAWPTSYKDDLGLAGDNYLDWYYYMISNTSTLTGWGDYEGSLLNLEHAPSSFYYGYQIGVGANNLTANAGNGGWINYSGWFYDASTGLEDFFEGGGDIGFDDSDEEMNPCIASLWRNWTATDCSGNSITHTQVITFTDNTAPVIFNVPDDIVIECGDSIPSLPNDIYAEDACGNLMSLDHTESMVMDSCTYHTVHVWTATDSCGNSSSASYTVHVVDTQSPVLSEMPEDIEVNCGELAPEAAIITATDNCDDDVEVVFTEIMSEATPSDPDDVDEVSSTELITPSMPDPAWSMALFSMPGGPNLFTTEAGEITVYDDTTGEGRTAHITATLVSTENPSAGFMLDLWLNNGVDWNTWSTMEWPTSYKNDAGLAGDNFEDWYYYLVNDSSTLTGWGDYTGSFLNLSHAPANQYFGYQVGIAANNVGPNDGNGGWMHYSGTFIDASQGISTTIFGDGDLAFDNGDDTGTPNDACSELITRTWTATDCSGNTTTHVQVITLLTNSDAAFYNVPGDVMVECGEDLPSLPDSVYVQDVCGAMWEISDSTATVEDSCTYHVIHMLTANACGTEISATYTVYVIDTQAPHLLGAPEDLVLPCGTVPPAPEEVSALDGCDGMIEVFFTETTDEDTISDPDDVDPTAFYESDLFTPDMTDPMWSLVLMNMPGGPMHFLTDSAHIIIWDDTTGTGRTGHITAHLVSSSNSDAGFDLDLFLSNGVDWNTWSSMAWPTSYKDDAGVAGDNYLDWYYYLIDNSSTLTGWGDYEGSFLNLEHAPANHYFAYQVGLAANNVNANSGSGGWISYSGTFMDSSEEIDETVNGFGDIAFDDGNGNPNSICTDPSIIRTWTATDCSGNTVTYTQTITFIIATDSIPEVLMPGIDIVRLFPNPMREDATVVLRSDEDINVQLTLSTILGTNQQDLFNGHLEANVPMSVQINTDIPSGIYNIVLSDRHGNRVTRKLVVE